MSEDFERWYEALPPDRRFTYAKGHTKRWELRTTAPAANRPAFWEWRPYRWKNYWKQRWQFQPLPECWVEACQ